MVLISVRRFHNSDLRTCLEYKLYVRSNTRKMLLQTSVKSFILSECQKIHIKIFETNMRHAWMRKFLRGDVLLVIVEWGQSFRQRYTKFKVIVLMCCLVCSSPVARLTSTGRDLCGTFHICHSLSAVWPLFCNFCCAEPDISLLVVAALPSTSEECWTLVNGLS